jgi:hypothetical protein
MNVVSHDESQFECSYYRLGKELVKMSVIGKLRHSPHRTTLGRSWSNNRQTSALGLSFYAAFDPLADNRTVEYFTARRGSDAIRHGKMEQNHPVAVIFMKPELIAYD